jgi:Uri superfamily endonuclease
MRGAYLLFINIRQPLKVEVGALGIASFPAGQYVYVGSACGGIEARLARHRRLAERKIGKIHWHIDYLLVNRSVQWVGEKALRDGAECIISRQIAARRGVTVPVPGFGASDCRSGCKAHLYLLPKTFRKPKLI